MLQQQKWIEEQVGDKTKASEADAKQFYDENKKEFEHPELIRASHILIIVPEGADEKTVTEKKALAQATLVRVTKNGEDFATVAKEVSEEPGAKQSGGDLNFFPKDRMVPEFANAAFAMKKGEVSNAPVLSKFGWHVIKVTDRKQAGIMPFDEVKAQVTSYLEGSKRRDAVSSVIDRLRANANVENKLPAADPTPTPAPGEAGREAEKALPMGKGDVPYAIPVPGKPGFVTSPHAPNSGFVDVRGFQRNAEVNDPYTGRIFLVP
jgi:peptidyl-prolyl cis-trans isomerase C